MKTINISDAEGAVLDWLVAKCQGYKVYFNEYLNSSKMEGFWVSGYYPGDLNSWIPLNRFSPSTEWSKCGPIIHDKRIDLSSSSDNGVGIVTKEVLDEHGGFAVQTAVSLPKETVTFTAYMRYGQFMQNGPTPMIAAMRCYVMSNLGTVIKVPDELI